MGLLLGTRRALVGTGEWTPAQATNGGYLPEHWYRSDSGIWQDAGVTPAASDGDVVGRWEDLTANADHVNQANAGNKPTLQNGAADLLNGHPVIRTDGIDDYLTGAFTTGGAMNQPNTVFVVAKADATIIADGLNHLIMDGDDAANRHFLYKSGADVWVFAAPTPTVSATAADAAWHTWTASANGASGQFWRDGVSLQSGNVGANALDGLTIFGKYDGTLPWKGDIVEIILYDANLSDADKNQVGAYLAARYGLAYTDI